MFQVATNEGQFRQHSPLPRPVAETWDMPRDEWKDVGHGKDLDRTAALLEDAGVPRDYNWWFIAPPDDQRERMAVVAAEGLRAAGWENVTVRRLDWGPFLETYVSGDEADYNVYALGWDGSPDPDTFTYYLLARTPDVLGVTNGTFYGADGGNGEDVSSALVRARRTADRPKRKRLYGDAITTVLEDRVHIPVYNGGRSHAVADHVDGFDVHPRGGMELFGSYTDTAVGN